MTGRAFCCAERNLLDSGQPVEHRRGEGDAVVGIAVVGGKVVQGDVFATLRDGRLGQLAGGGGQAIV